MLLLAMLATQAYAADPTPPERPRTFVSTSLFMVFNALPESPHYGQLNVGRRLTDRDTLIVEAATWRYFSPPGIPLGPNYGADENRYPGFVRDTGIGLAYQRFWWKGLFTTVHAMPFVQTYHEPDGSLIQTGFQLFLIGRLGYHIPLFKKRMFIEPSIAPTAWPVNTNAPDAFAAQDDRWPQYFFADPGLNVGVQF